MLPLLIRNPRMLPVILERLLVCLVRALSIVGSRCPYRDALGPPRPRELAVEVDAHPVEVADQAVAPRLEQAGHRLVDARGVKAQKLRPAVDPARLGPVEERLADLVPLRRR